MQHYGWFYIERTTNAGTRCFYRSVTAQWIGTPAAGS